MDSSRKLHVFLLLLTILFLGVATAGFVLRPRTRSGEKAGPPSAAPQPAEASATALDSGGRAAKPPAPPVDAQAKPRTAAVVVPPALALKFEKRYRDMSPTDTELAYQQLGTKLREEVRRGASEESVHELRCEVAWLTERRPRKE